MTSTTHLPSTERHAQHRERLQKLRAAMHEKGVDALVVRSTDRYLNEYVPEADSTRQFISGFTGSMGDALITLTEAFIVVDGRYHLQAEQEVDPSTWQVVKLTLAEPIFTGLANKLISLVRDDKVHAVGFESERTTVHEKDTLERLLHGTKATLVALSPSPIEALMTQKHAHVGQLRVLDEARVGRTSAQKVQAIQDALARAGLDLLLVEKLDDLAYLTNLRADDLPYQATFKGMGAVGRNGALLCLHTRAPTSSLQDARPAFRIVTESEFPEALQAIAGAGRKAAYDGATTTDRNRELLVKAGFAVTPLTNPLTEMKAKKTPEELTRMVEAFKTADDVVSKCTAWLCRAVEKGERVTEADFAHHVEKTFKKSGATGLSFKVISAAGANGAIVHYSTPDPERVIQKGELMLLDTGAYYGEGYATDLTRTFLVGGPKTQPDEKQKRLYTLTLKAAISGMTAVVPVGAPGITLDAITRKPLWDVGLNYNHGTGHGVGINVHEAPPSISMRSMLPLHTGYVFSIEPGVYISGWGGIRIENLCTLVEAADRPGFLQVRPLTFSPLDARLVDKALLAPHEREFLKHFKEQSKLSPEDIVASVRPREEKV